MTDETPSAPQPSDSPDVAIIEVVYPPERGTIGIRGSHDPLSWESTKFPDVLRGNRSLFRIGMSPGEVLELKLVRNDEAWAEGRNYAVHAGDHLRIEPWFDTASCTLEPPASVSIEGGEIRYQVLLPPSYSEQTTKRYPVIYALDGQALWSTSQDPYGVWNLDTAVNYLIELGAMEEVILVGIDVSERRVERLSPVADPTHGGGEGPAFLKGITDTLRPAVDAAYRTRTGRESTAVMGSSMGGLFAFFAAWTRPDVFGQAACLSSSFWWADRWAVRLVQSTEPASPRPTLYVDSGASLNADESDPNVRDGYFHTRSMWRALAKKGYTPGVDLHRLVFAGHSHDAASWSARVSVPLQVLFPPPPSVAADWAIALASGEVT